MNLKRVFVGSLLIFTLIVFLAKLFRVQYVEKLYAGNTITSFRKQFNNHKSGINRYGIARYASKLK